MNDEVKGATANKLASADVKKKNPDVCKQSSEEQRDKLEELVKKLKTTIDKIEKLIKQISTGIVMYILCNTHIPSKKV